MSLQIVDILELQRSTIDECDAKGIWFNDELWTIFWFRTNQTFGLMGLKGFECPKCGSKKLYQKICDPCTDGYCKKPENQRVKDRYGYNCPNCSLDSVSFIACRECNHMEYDD